MTTALTLPSGMASEEPPHQGDPLPGRLDKWLAANGAELVAVRRHIHANPELSGQEFATSALIAAKLKAVGIDSVEELLEKGAHTRDREEIAGNAGFTYERILDPKVGSGGRGGGSRSWVSGPAQRD